MTLDEYFAQYGDEYRGFLSYKPAFRELVREGMLLFDEDTACNWGGPFPGNYAYYKIERHLEPLRTEAEERLKFRFSRSVYGIHPPWGEDAKSEEHLQKRLSQLTEKQRKAWQKCQDGFEIDQPTVEKPVSLYMCGNDDTTYTKFFATVEEALEEVEMLEADQPLCTFTHIYENGFVFTN